MRKLLLLVSIVVLVDTSFYAAITPLLPELTDEYGLSKTGAGILAAAYPIGTFVGGLPGGFMAARVGVRPTRVARQARVGLADPRRAGSAPKQGRAPPTHPHAGSAGADGGGGRGARSPSAAPSGGPGEPSRTAP